jgi:demethoxyubiquinone hydroxylase (CLK1/Coq7/Cat5 family)
MGATVRKAGTVVNALPVSKTATAFRSTRQVTASSLATERAEGGGRGTRRHDHDGAVLAVMRVQRAGSVGATGQR